MSILKILIILIANSYFCFSQKIDNVYILFNKTEEKNGNKNSYYYNGKFVVSEQCFEIKKNSLVKSINKDSIKNLKIVSIKEFYEKCKKNGMKYVFDPNLLYKQIFILEVYNEIEYLIFEVKWKPYYNN